MLLELTIYQTMKESRETESQRLRKANITAIELSLSQTIDSEYRKA